MKTLNTGSVVPSFETQDQDQNRVTNKDLIGKKSIVFFYPRANTPGCTAEACNLRDHYKTLQGKGYQLFGVSADSSKKQKSFADKASSKGDDADIVMVKYVKSVKSEKTGFWRFNEQMVKLRGGEDLNAALKRMGEASNLVDIDLSGFESQEDDVEKKESPIEENSEVASASDIEGEEE